jgi:hypothetical protein
LDYLSAKTSILRIELARDLQAYRKVESMSELSEMKCTACRGDEPTLTDAEIAELRPQIPEWHVVQREGAWSACSGSVTLPRHWLSPTE